MSRPFRAILLGDYHCGHCVGLTPPKWQWRATAGHTRRDKIATIQAEQWAWYAATIKRIGPVDLVLANGDLIDGSGHRSGGTEQITTDRQEQTDMAVECLRAIKARQYVMTYGTAYHTGDEEDFEDHIAERMDAQIG